MTGCYPFSAVVGQEKTKRALLLACINPAVGGVLLVGERGCAKSVLAYGLQALFPDRKLLTIPLNASPDRLLGTVSSRALIKEGRLVREKGILESARGGILIADEINLFQDGIANLILEAVEAPAVNGNGITLIGTMDPEEGLLRPQLLERFGLCVFVRAEKEPERRAEILRRRIAFERAGSVFSESFFAEDDKLRRRLTQAAGALSSVKIPGDALSLASDIAGEALCPGNRAEIFLIEAARAAAALDGLNSVTQDCLREAAQYVLPHRMRREAERSEETPSGEPDDAARSDDSDISDDTRQDAREERPEAAEGTDSEKQPDPPESPIPVHIQKETGPRQRFIGEGKRVRTRLDSRTGRMIRSAQRDFGELAVSDTLKEAALHLKQRCPPEGLALELRKEDIRRQVKEGRTGATILFAVDASGSMGARKRMLAVKSAVLSLLQDAYEKRDKVGIVTFRGSGAQLLLPPTRSIELARRRLARLPTGGTTPLAAGLAEAYRVLCEERLRQGRTLQYLVLLTDGRSNVGMKGLSAADAALGIAERLGQSDIRCMVLDTENRYISVGLARELAEKMRGRHESLPELSGARLRGSTADFIRR